MLKSRLHYYFYFIDEELGLCYVRVPTWCPFGLQAYFNGHNWLATQLDKLGIAYTLKDNAFTDIADWDKAQKLADGLSTKKLHKLLDQFGQRYCPVFSRFMSRVLKRLRLHGLIKKVSGAYKYYLAKLERHVITARLKLTQFFLIPELAAAIGN